MGTGYQNVAKRMGKYLKTYRQFGQCSDGGPHNLNILTWCCESCETLIPVQRAAHKFLN